MTGASKADEALWGEFEDDWQAMAALSEELCQRVHGTPKNDTEPEETSDKRDEIPALLDSVETERTAETRVRLAQNLFRRTVLSAYDGSCCITGNPVPELLIAAHIIPWSECPEERLNPRNGLCLSRLHEAAFDRGLITLDTSLRLVVSKELEDYLPNEALQAEFIRYRGEGIRPPQKFAPDGAFLEAHREEVFRG